MAGAQDAHLERPWSRRSYATLAPSWLDHPRLPAVGFAFQAAVATRAMTISAACGEPTAPCWQGHGVAVTRRINKTGFSGLIPPLIGQMFPWDDRASGFGASMSPTCCPDRSRIRPGQPETADQLAAGEARQVSAALLVGVVDMDGKHGEARLCRHSSSGGWNRLLDIAGDQAIGGVARVGAPKLLGQADAEDAGRPPLPERSRRQ